MRLTVLGCGDAFGSGGRLQSAYLVAVGGKRMLIDCGATTGLAMKRAGINPASIPAIVISHLHGDHFAGLVWFVLEAVYVGKRKAPLEILGPAGIELRFTAAAEALFPGFTTVERGFDLCFTEMVAERRIVIGVFTVTAFEVEHPSGGPSHALRCEADGRVLAFSGDTQWTESLLRAGGGADLFLLECYTFEGAPRYHLSWEVIRSQLDRIGVRQVVLTHMSEAMLARCSEVDDPRVGLAEDGLVIEI